eukprot:CAMPEP_0203759604 /NCGR_PEP_ID=MMETSP0098-20131031/12671_1 /ASSEMBLY_ACC=CAM_ASM_000208 /TAXON_ID=96639 /ORGANISM=" , Strain NY0313808BC1" /LENGTH=363 /DNA_ID=CAMNT_0050652669 /DNA_START=80 /DNA_END=1171 /DNA_ORIENTATION=-
MSVSGWLRALSLVLFVVFLRGDDSTLDGVAESESNHVGGDFVPETVVPEEAVPVEADVHVEDSVLVEEVAEPARILEEEPEDMEKRRRLEAEREAALEEGRKLREEAVNRARARRRKELGESAPHDDEFDKDVVKLETLLTKAERRALEAELKKAERRRTLVRHAEEQRRLLLEEGAEAAQHRMLQEVVEESCFDNTVTGSETDTDCGGESCRDTQYEHMGMPFYKKCAYAQSCNVAEDCLSGSCTDGKCDARLPFQVVDDAELLRNMHAAYFQISEEKGEETLKPADVQRFYELSINPDGQDLTPEQASVLAAGVENLRRTQGLGDDNEDVVVMYGFLTRGQCFTFAKDLIASALALPAQPS